MSGIAVAIGGSALLGAYTANQASKRQTQAGQAAIDTQEHALDLQNQIWQQNQANLAPWMTGGQNAFGALQGYAGIGPGGTFDPNAPGVKPFGVEDFRADPGYEWAKNQGLDAVLNKRSAMGGLFSGNTMRALEDYGQGLANQQYQNAYNRYNQNIGNVWSRLGGLSTFGQNAAAGTGTLGSNFSNAVGANANQVGNLQTSIGNVQGAGIMGVGNAAQGGINNWLLAQSLQNGQYGGGAGGYQPPNSGYISLPPDSFGYG